MKKSKKRKVPDFGAVDLTPPLERRKTVQLMNVIHMDYEPHPDNESIVISFSTPMPRVVLPRKLLKEMASA